MTFTVYNTQTAPEDSAPLLKKIEQKKGYVPNLMGVMAESPTVLEAFLQLDDAMRQTSFSDQERDVILLAASAENHSEYCAAAHTQQAENHGLPTGTTDKIKAAAPLSDRKLESLRRYTLAVMHNKGRPDDNVIAAFLAAGYGPQQALEIVLGITLKTLTNYTYRLAHPDIDHALQIASVAASQDERMKTP